MMTGLFDDYENYSLPENIGNIPPEQFETAIRLRKECLEVSLDTASRRFLHTLAVGGLVSWFTSWANSPGEQIWGVDAQNCSLYRPEYTHAINAACNLEINGFQVCLLPFPYLFGNSIDIPRAVIDVSRWSAHFYIPVEVSTSGFVKTSADDEGSPQVLIHGFWRYDQLRQQIDTGQVEFKRDWNYSVPLSWCDSNLDHLWLSLNRLEPQMIPLPQASEVAELSQQDWNVWERRLERVRKAEVHLWQAPDELTWSNAKTFFNHPELIEKWYRLCAEEVSKPKPGSYCPAITWRPAQMFSELVANLQGARPALAQFRYTDVDSVRKAALAIKTSGLSIPDTAMVEEGTFALEERPLRVTVFTWNLGDLEKPEVVDEETEKHFIAAISMEELDRLNPHVKAVLNSAIAPPEELQPKRGDYFLIVPGHSNLQSATTLTIRLGEAELTIELFSLH